MRIHRMISILLLLESKGTIKAKELADALETSERTIYRDMDILCESGVPIYSDPGPKGGFTLMEGYNLNLNTLRCDDVVSLYLSGSGIRPNKESDAHLALKNTLLKLESVLPVQYAADLKIAKERFYFDPEMWWEEPVPIKFLDLLRKSIWQSIKLSFLYLKANQNQNERSKRRVRPYGLVVKNQDWYLVGYCEMRKALRVFRCDRIINVETVEDESFSVPEDFVLEKFWKEWQKEFELKITKENHSNYRVILKVINEKFLNENLDFKPESYDSEQQKLIINFHSFYEAKEKMKLYMDQVVVIEPLELKAFVTEYIKDLSKLYS